MMDFLQELLLTAALSLLLAFLIAKITSPAAGSFSDFRRVPAEDDAVVAGREVEAQGHASVEEESASDEGTEKFGMEEGGERGEVGELDVVGVVDEVEARDFGFFGVGNDGIGEEMATDVVDGEGTSNDLHVASVGADELSGNDRIIEVEFVLSPKDEGSVEAGEARPDPGKLDVEMVKGHLRLGDREIEDSRTGSSVEGDESQSEITVEEAATVQEETPQREIRAEEVVMQEGRSLLIEDDDDWEGIERSDVEKFFGEAMAFVNSAAGSEALSRLSSDLELQLYGLHKVATEGPCHGAQPLALKVSARAKWNAWQRLGDMDREVAMEHYISLLSSSITGWMVGNLRDERKQGGYMQETSESKVEHPGN